MPLLLSWVMWPIKERRMSELESPGSYRVWGWQHQLEDTYKFQQVRKVRIPFLAVSVHFCAFFFFIYPPPFFFL